MGILSLPPEILGWIWTEAFPRSHRAEAFSGWNLGGEAFAYEAGACDMERRG